MNTTVPRIEPLGEAEWNDAQRKVLEPLARNGRVDNVFGTLARHVDLFDHFLQFGRYILSSSTLPPREREILILRMGWLCQAEYEWAQHAAIGKRAGLTDDEVCRIAAGPDAPGWDTFDAALLNAVDELHRDSIVSDATWAALAQRYSTEQLMDAVLTAGQYNQVSMALNTFGVQIDERLKERFPPAGAPPAVIDTGQRLRLTKPRIEPLAQSEWSQTQRELLKPLTRDDGGVMNLYATLVRHPTMFAPRLAFGQYVQKGSTLPPRDREILILRTAWLCGAEYEWGHHARIAQGVGMHPDEIRRIAQGPEAAGWSTFETILLRAVDELHKDAWIHDSTWSALAEKYSTHQCMDAVFTVGGYKMLAMLLGSLGVQRESGVDGFPSQRGR